MNSQLKEEKKQQQETLSEPTDNSLYFVKQLVANACGTIAIVHAIANNLDKIQLEEGKGLRKFIENTKENSPLERGEKLGYDECIAQAHETSSKKGQTVSLDVFLGIYRNKRIQIT